LVYGLPRASQIRYLSLLGNSPYPHLQVKSHAQPQQRFSGGDRSYRYKPLPGPDSIRILSLLPGTQGDDIKIRLHHKKLSEISTCEALSYEWGEPTCINQEDLKERLQQVASMSTIYKSAKETIMWLGEETLHTQDAFNVIPRLSDARQGLVDLPLSGHRGQVKDRSALCCADELQNLLTESVWIGLQNLYFRSYFDRLWIMQEICLSSKASIVCGSHSIDWNIFWVKEPYNPVLKIKEPYVPPIFSDNIATTK
jgi:hypothetical protein